MAETSEYRDGQDLILSVPVDGVQTALGHSDECKFSLKAETGSRKTKEVSAGKWEEKYIKTQSATITASGFVHTGDESKAGLPTLMDLFFGQEAFMASWNYRDNSSVNHYSGNFIITQIEDEGKAGDDEKYSFTLENSGPVTKVTA